MSSEHGLVSYWHETYDGELFVRQHDIQKAALRIGGLLGRKAELPGLPELAARNIHFGMVDLEGESHPLMLGGVAFGPDLSMTFWSSPHTEHSRLVSLGRKASVLVAHTHEPSTSLRMKKMDVSQVPADETAAYLNKLNSARLRHGFHARIEQEFTDQSPEGSKALYVAMPSSDPTTITIPLSAYSKHEGDRALVWQRSVSYPIAPADIF